MGKYTTKALDAKEYKNLIDTIRKGYTHNGSHHKPNNQVADILVLEANLGCRLGDIIKLRTDSIVFDGEVWKLNITEQKTKKLRSFVIPSTVKSFIDNIAGTYTDGKELFSLSKQAVWKALRQVTEYLGLKDTSSHSLRKMAGINLLESCDYDFSTVKEFYQHTSIATTSTYLKRSSKHMEKAIGKIVCIH